MSIENFSIITLSKSALSRSLDIRKRSSCVTIIFLKEGDPFSTGITSATTAECSKPGCNSSSLSFEKSIIDRSSSFSLCGSEFEAANFEDWKVYVHEEAGISGVFGEVDKVEVVEERRKDEFDDDFKKEEARSLFMIVELRNDEFKDTGRWWFAAVKVVADWAAADVFDLGETRLSFLLVLRKNAIEEAGLWWVLSVEIVGRRHKEVESLFCVIAVVEEANDEFEGAGQWWFMVLEEVGNRTVDGLETEKDRLSFVTPDVLDWRNGAFEEEGLSWFVEVVGRRTVDIDKEESLSFGPAEVVERRKDEFDDDFEMEEASSLFLTVELSNDEINETGRCWFAAIKVVADWAAADVFDLGEKTRQSCVLHDVLDWRNDAIEEVGLSWFFVAMEVVWKRTVDIVKEEDSLSFWPAEFEETGRWWFMAFKVFDRGFNMSEKHEEGHRSITSVLLSTDVPKADVPKANVIEEFNLVVNGALSLLYWRIGIPIDDILVEERGTSFWWLWSDKIISSRKALVLEDVEAVFKW